MAFSQTLDRKSRASLIGVNLCTYPAARSRTWAWAIELVSSCHLENVVRVPTFLLQHRRIFDVELIPELIKTLF
jgi:hypothetical protein